MKWNVKTLVINAAIAALYAALTVALEPISYGAVQFRLAEVMTLLAFANPAFTPGLVLGCAIANLFSPLGIVDVAVGTFATFLAVYPMRYCKNIWIASLLPVISNGLLVGIELTVLFQLPLFASILSVAAGEFVVVSLLGVSLYHVLMQGRLKHLQPFQ